MVIVILAILALLGHKGVIMCMGTIISDMMLYLVIMGYCCGYGDKGMRGFWKIFKKKVLICATTLKKKYLFRGVITLVDIYMLNYCYLALIT